ncbi:MAG: metal ABC transporter permease, partial [Microlunatus sp.]|nr:metal ABC transporter permease [Microlunatus sp.]
LFGSLTTVTETDLLVIAVLAVLVLVPTLGLAPQLFAVSTDEEFARTQGLRTSAYNIAIVVLAAVTVTLAMRTVGLLLVSALMVVPVAAAQNLVRGFYAALVAAMAVGTTVTVGGAVGSFYLDTPPGALIVVLAIGVFALSWPYSALIARRRRVAPVLPELVDDDTLTVHQKVPEEHPHRHGPDCEHAEIRHGDHIDYVHEGHRHAVHGDHYDEH